LIPTLSPQVNAAPSLTPTIYDPAAPNAQRCPGYKATGVKYKANGFTADLNIAGAYCQAFGNDVATLKILVEYQTQDRLNVKIWPKYLSLANTTQYVLPTEIVEAPAADGKTTNCTSDLKLEWTNEPSFQFRVLRSRTGEELFSTYGHVIVFEDQFLELVTNMVKVGSCHIRLSDAYLRDDVGLQRLRSCREHSRFPPGQQPYTDVLCCRRRQYS
jgi:alpha-glucosidase